MSNFFAVLKKHQVGFFSLLFAISYPQETLYYGAQNTYFLHGLARAGEGHLQFDWLANTTDPFPLFSFVTYLTETYLDRTVFYLYHILISGIYFYALAKITTHILKIERKGTQFYLAGGLFLIHSQLFRDLSLKLIGIDGGWYVQGGVADQFLLGPAFLPHTFGVFLLLSIWFFVSQKSSLAIISGSIAVAFHSSYLLSFMFLVLAYMFITYSRQGGIKKAIQIGLGALFMVSPILLYNFIQFGPDNPSIWAEAQNILVNIRIPHHAKPEIWINKKDVVKIILIFAVILIIRKEKLFFTLAFLFMGGVILTTFQLLLNNNTLALLFPWRVSVVLAPISAAILLGKAVQIGTDKFRDISPGRISILNYVYGGIILVAFVWGIKAWYGNLNSAGEKETVAMMDHVKAIQRDKNLYLIPIELREFRLYTGVPVLADFKSHPYKDKEVLEWYSRIKLADSFYQYINNPEKSGAILEKLINLYGINHILIEGSSNVVAGENYSLVEIYRNHKYRIFEVKTDV